MAKAYIIYAYKNDDPNDLLFAYEKNNGDLIYVKDRCRVFYHNELPSRQFKLKDAIENDFERYKSYKRHYAYRNKKRIRTWLNDISSCWYNVYGETAKQWSWRLAKHKAAQWQPPQGYTNVVCRLNSKYCPIRIDVMFERKCLKNKKGVITSQDFCNLPFKMI